MTEGSPPWGAIKVEQKNENYQLRPIHAIVGSKRIVKSGQSAFKLEGAHEVFSSSLPAPVVVVGLQGPSSIVSQMYTTSSGSHGKQKGPGNELYKSGVP